MKLQDFFFLGVLGVVFFIRRPIYFVWAGLLSLFLAIPLFAFWVFFTAQRLTWYAAAFFFIFILFSLLRPSKVQ